MAGPFFSTQLTNVNNVVVNQPGQLGGDGFIIPFNYTTPSSGAPAVGEFVYLNNIPEGFYVSGIFVNSEALSSGAGTAGADLGDDDSGQRYGAAFNFDAAVNQFLAIAPTAAAGFLFRNDKLRLLRATVTGEAWATSKKFFGFVLGFRDA
jgi:hypothetical protein